MLGLLLATLLSLAAAADEPAAFIPSLEQPRELGTALAWAPRAPLEPALAQSPGEPGPDEDAPPQVPADQPDEPWQRTGWGFGGVPALNYNTDEGFGFGVLASFYRYDGETAPYSWSSTILIFFTTKAVMSHRIDFDFLNVGGLPLRLTTRLAFNATRTANFCGYGHEVTCDPAVAEAEADERALTGDERDEYIKNYYRLRWVMPYAYLNARYRLGDWDPKTELFAGWRGEYYVPGDLTTTGPYEGSLYDQVTDDERGFTSLFQLGLMVDTRDNEPAPRRGYWHEVSLRGGAPFVGSAWTFGGFNLTARFYAPVLPDGRLTLASRTMFDGLWGDQNAYALSLPGGSELYSFGGGDQAGRGIRLRRYIGRIKAMEQLSMRWAFWRPEPFGVGVELTWLAFLDVLTAAEDWADFTAAFSRPVAGVGTGLRIAIEQNFIIRIDAGFSGVEDWSPGIYIDVDHLF